jgi:filamentous hemagglutinin family protein
MKHVKLQIERKVVAVLAGGAFAASVGAAAGPTAPVVVSGQAAFSQQGNVFSITTSPSTIINWQSFSVNPGEVTRFVQQSASSAVLNRIVGQDPSQILGTLQSNGHVFLINPNGILFGAGARVDVGALTASTLNLSNADFLAGKNNFYAVAGAPVGAIRNLGAIGTPSGGKVSLVAGNVENGGVISAPRGEVVLAAGQSVSLVDTDYPALQVVVSAPADAAINLGRIIAEGGKVGLYGTLVKQRGLINANSAVVGEQGQIVFKASGDTLLEAGSVTSATGAGKGGDIMVLGQRVGLTGDAQVDASGQLGGGSVRIGGDYQGKNPALMNAQQTYVGADAAIRADAIASGDGGKVIVWSDDLTRYYGTLSAAGGAAAGNGGFAEVSGKQKLVFQGTARLGAARGKAGTLLLDPHDVSIEANADTLGVPSGPFLFDASDLAATTSVINAGTITNILDTLGSVQIVASGAIDVNSALDWAAATNLSLTANSGNITIAAPISNHTSAAAFLSLIATSGNIVQSAPIQVANVAARASGNVALTSATNAISTIAGTSTGSGNSFSVVSAGSPITGANAASAPLTVGAVDTETGITTNNGALSVQAVGLVLDESINAHAGAVTLSADSGGIVNSSGRGLVVAASLEVLAASSVTLNAPNSIGTLAAAITGAGNGIAINNDATSLVVGTAGGTSGIAATGDIALASSNSINLASGAVLQTVGHTIDLKADALDLAPGTIAATGTGGLALLRPFTDSTTIALAATDHSGAAGTLRLTNADLGAAAGSTAVRVGALSGGAIDIVHPLTAVLPSLGLLSGGTITQQAGATIDGPLALRASGSSVALLDANSVGAIAGGASMGSFQFRSTHGVSVATVDGVAGINAGDGVAYLRSDSVLGITQTGAAGIQAGTLSLKSLGAVVLDDGANQFGALNADLSGGSGGLTARSATALLLGAITTSSNGAITARSDGLLTVGGALDAGGSSANVDLRGASLLLGASASIDAKAITLRATAPTTGAISNVAGTARVGGSATTDITLAADTYELTHVATPTFNASHMIVATSHTDNADMVTSGLSPAVLNTPILQLGNGAAGDANTTNNLTVDSLLNRAGKTLVLAAGGTITQSAAITAGALSINAGTVAGAAGDATLDNVGNSVTTLSGTTNGGALAFTNAGALTVGTVTDGMGNSMVGLTINNGNGALTASSGALTVNAPISAGSGNLRLIATTGAVTGSAISANALRVEADGAIGLSTHVGDIYAYTSAANADITIDNVGVLQVTRLQQSGSGKVTLNNTGAVTVKASNDGPVITAGTGAISITAHSPLTVDGRISSSAGGAIKLEAGSSGSVNDKLVISSTGSVITDGPISLKAGDTITVLGTVTQGKVTSQASLNTPPPPPPPPPPAPPTLAQCKLAPADSGCSAVLPPLSLCTTAPATDGCAVVLPSVSACTAAPTTAGCTAVLPSVAACTIAPTTAGCSAVLPSVAACTTAPTTAGCAAVLPSVAVCTAAPTTAGCSAVLPSVAACTTAPTTAGCAAVLPSVAVCTAAPTTAGCAAVLPSVAVCTTAPTTAGCAAVLPSVAVCTAAPTTAGCSAVLPRVAVCTAAPTTAGCAAVLPSLAVCTAAPATPGCAAVLPSVAICATAPTTAGCSAVLPPLAACIVTPTAPGCTVVLPTLAACIVTPTAPGCSVTLPSLASCQAFPFTPGCAAVLPTLSQCTATPTLGACATVLPSLAQCTGNAALAGCSAVLPTLSQCVSVPTKAGCVAVLPTLVQCGASPTLQGCSVVLPTISSCAAHPVDATCTVLTPVAQSNAPMSPVAQAVNTTVVLINASAGGGNAAANPLLTPSPAPSSGAASDDSAGKGATTSGSATSLNGASNVTPTKKTFCN